MHSLSIDLKAVAWIGFSPLANPILQSTANPAPPDMLDANALGRLIASREFRYVTLADAFLTCENGNRVASSSGGSGILGWSKEAWPYNIHHPIDWQLRMTSWVLGEEMDPVSHLENKDGNCIEFGMFTRFRVGQFGNIGLGLLHWVTNPGTFMGWVPWFYHILGGKLCCDGSYEVALIHTRFPNHAMYIDNRKVEASDPFAQNPNVWFSVMQQQWITTPGQIVYDAIGGVMHYRGNKLTGEGPTRISPESR